MMYIRTYIVCDCSAAKHIKFSFCPSQIYCRISGCLSQKSSHMRNRLIQNQGFEAIVHAWRFSEIFFCDILFVWGELFTYVQGRMFKDSCTKKKTSLASSCIQCHPHESQLLTCH